MSVLYVQREYRVSVQNVPTIHIPKSTNFWYKNIIHATVRYETNFIAVLVLAALTELLKNTPNENAC